jgi:hypothetical protein
MAVEFEDEDCFITKTVSFAFEELDLVVDSFEFAAGDLVSAGIEDACPISPQDLDYRIQ